MQDKSEVKKIPTKTDTRGGAYKNLTSLTNHETGKSRYRTNALVNRGGAKSIYSSFDKSSGRNIAMGMLTDYEASEEIKERFIYEARITANLEHPNIVPVHEIGYDKSDNPYFTMKLIEGETLGQIINELHSNNAEYQTKYPLGYLLDMFNQVCNAVAFAHSKGIIHLDIKPDNIQIGKFGEVLVLDWGLAKYTGKAESNPIHFEEEYRQTHRIDQNFLDHLSSVTYDNIDLTIDGSVKGSPGYMAPEQAAGENTKRDKRTDVYALGALLYSILTHSKPFKGDTVSDIFANNIKGDFIHPQKRTPDRYIPAALESITVKAMMREPDTRYQSVHELIEDVTAYKHGYATSAQNASLFTHLILLMKRHKIEFTAVVAVIFILISAFAFSYDKIQTQKDLAEHSLNQFIEEKKVREQAELAQQIAVIEKEQAQTDTIQAQKVAKIALKEKDVIAVEKQKVVAEKKELFVLKVDAEKKKVVAEQIAKKAVSAVKTISAQKDKAEQNTRTAVAEKQKVEETVKQLTGEKAQVEASLKQQTVLKTEAEQKTRTIVAEKKKVEDTVKVLKTQRVEAELVAKTATEDKDKAVQDIARVEREKQQVVNQIVTEKKKTVLLAKEKRKVEQIVKSQKHKVAVLAKEKAKVTKRANTLEKEKNEISKLASKEFYAKAQYFWHNYEFDKALFYVNLATTYNPSLTEAFTLKGKLLLKEFKFREAAEAYTKGKRVKISSLLTSFIKQTRNLTKLTDTLLLGLSTEIFATGDSTTTTLILKQILKKYSKMSEGNKKKAIDLLSKSLGKEFILMNFSGLPPQLTLAANKNGLDVYVVGYVKDISPLKGLNITNLHINTKSQIIDFDFLHHFPLDKLNITILNAGPNNLTFLKGLKLQSLTFTSQTPLQKADTIAGMPLDYLSLENTAILDLKFISKMPLKDLIFKSSEQINLNQLKKLNLINLSLANNNIDNIDSLKSMKLQRLNISGTNVTNLSPLSRLKLKYLLLNNTEVSSLHGLKGMKLEHLEMVGTPIDNLKILENMPLQKLEIAECGDITDLSPLKKCKSLISVSVPYHLNDYTFIKKLANLKYIDIERISGTEQTVKRFKELMDIN